MKTQNVILMFAAAAAVAVGVLLLLRRRAAAASAPAAAAAVQVETAPQASYSGFLATNAAPPAKAGQSLTSQITSGYASVMGAAGEKVCNSFTGGNAGPLCDVAAGLQTKFSKLVADGTVGTVKAVGGKLVSGAKSVFNKLF